jgi:hypothetical protein
MWKRIHSNRDPRDTLFTELKNEFRPWLGKANESLVSATRSHPRFFFAAMIVLLLISFGLSFTIFRHPEKPVPALAGHRDPVGDGFGQIMKATGQLRETLKLKQTVDSLSAKKQLSAADSLRLESALDRLRLIHPDSK